MKKLNNIIILLILLINTYHFLYSQNTVNYDNVQRNFPPSPNVNSLLQFADYPVSYYTGLPNINIPIYNLKVDYFELPITLNYHSSGFRPSQEASWVGLGWALNVNCAISRSVKGIDDFANNGNGSVGSISKGYYYSPEINSYTNGNYDSNHYNLSSFKLIAEQEPDIFSFCLPNFTGKFLLDKKNGPILFDKTTNLKIEVVQNSISTDNTFVVTDTKGTKYIFDKKEMTQTISNNRRLVNNEYQTYSYLYFLYQDDNSYQNFVSTWLLTKIILENKKEINFIYTEETYISPGYESCIKYNQIPGDFSGSSCMTEILPSAQQKLYSSNMEVISCYRLNSINWDMGSIEFFASKREDLKSLDAPKKLDKIIVKNLTGSIIKQFDFYYDYFENQTNTTSSKDYLYKRLKLNSLNELGVGNYSFSYIEGDFPAKNTNAIDYWGFYNGKEYGDNYYTQAYNGLQLLSGALKTSDETKMKYGVLKKIKYPTGGNVQFDFEINEVNYSGTKYILGSDITVNFVGGLRIKQIKNEDSNGIIKLRNFKYFGGKVIKPLICSYIKEIHANGCNCTANYNLFVQTSNSQIPLTSLSYGNIVGYNEVEESTQINNKISFINYTYFNNIEDDEEDGTSIFPFGSSTINYYNGLPVEIKWGYKNTDDGTKYFTKKIEYSYNSYYIKSIYAFHTVLNSEYLFLHSFQNEGFCGWVDSPPLGYSYRFEWIKKETEKIITSNTTEGVINFNSSNSLTETISYTNFDNLNSKAKTISSDLVSCYYYPQDYPNDAICVNMKDNYKIESIIEKLTFNKGKIISGEKMKFRYDTNCQMYVPDISYVLSLPNDFILTLNNYKNYFHPKIHYELYNSKGKSIQIKIDEDNIVFIWSYNSNYPIFEIKNAIYSQVEAILTPGFISNLNSTYPTDAVIQSAGQSLRSALPNALVTTYTYKPLIGMSSQTDPRGVTTYYEYDGFNRLKYIRDKDNKILQSFDYNYKQQ